MYTYKQEIKEEARELIWKHAIRSLTENRNRNLVIGENYVRDVWDYLLYKCEYTKNVFKNKACDIAQLNNWINFSRSTYGIKAPEELKIVYLCGPEPENDLEVMLKQGIRIENVWAIESEEKSYKQAIESVRNRYHNLKIFHGNISDFFDVYSQVFDIIYLDFISPIFSDKGTPYNVMHKIFDKNILNELGIIITNYPVPEYTDNNGELLSDFFYDLKHLPSEVIGQKDDDGNISCFFTDSAYCYGYSENDFKKIIKENYVGAYSAFCSFYPVYYAGIIAPRYRVSNKKATFNMLYASDKAAYSCIDNGLYDKWSGFGDCQCPEMGFIERLKQSSFSTKMWTSGYGNKESEKRYTRYESAKIAAALINYEYYNMKDIVAQEMCASINRTYKAIEFYEKSRLFCDILLPSDLIEVVINQIGIPYHVNYNNHKRFEYTAKQRTMFVDIFTFDKCRSFYDWMPLVELYGENIANLEGQLLFKACLDALGKQYSFTPIPNYDGGINTIGMFEVEWSQFVHSLPIRNNLE